MVVTYHPGLPNIGGILRHLQPLLHCSDKCKKAIKEVPLISFQRPKSLGDYLVHSKLKRTDRTEPRSMGTVRCGSGRCQVCQHLEPGDTFTSHITHKKYSIDYELDCNRYSTWGQLQQNLGLCLTAISLVSERILDFLMETRAKMILSIDISMLLDTMALKM